VENNLLDEIDRTRASVLDLRFEEAAHGLLEMRTQALDVFVSE
jgi:hypothetical protein